MWLVLAALTGLFRVEGQTDCPTPDAVGAALAKLGGLTSAGAGDRIALAAGDEGLTVRWLDGAGHERHTWRLPRDGTCQELADAAALVVAVWAGHVDAGRVPSPQLPEAGPPVEPRAQLFASARRSRLAYEVAAALLVGWEPGAAASFGGSAVVTLGPRSSRFTARLALSAQSLQRHDIAIGRIGWTRPALSLGAQVRLARAALVFDLSIDAVAALLVLDGEGFHPTHQSYDFDPGLDVGVRLGYRLRWVTPFVEARLVGWLRPQTAVLDGLGSRFDLPRIDLWMSVGLAFSQ
jgi:hypothetical protein